MPVDLSRIMVTDSMLQLLLVRYACIWQTNWGIERASGGESWQLSCGHSGYVEGETHVGLCEIWVKAKEDDVRAGFAGDESLLVVHAPAPALL